MVKTDLVKTISLVASFGLACFPGLKTHIFEKGFQSGDFPLCRRVDRRKQSILKMMATRNQLYPITSHSLWSWSPPSKASTMSRWQWIENTFLMDMHHVVSQFVLFLQGGYNLSETSVAKTFSGFVRDEVTQHASNFRQGKFTGEILLAQITFCWCWKINNLQDWSCLAVSIILFIAGYKVLQELWF